MSCFRAFIAVDLAPFPALEPFLKDLSGLRGLKPVDASNLHITLKFLGDIEETSVKELEAAIRASSEGIAPFEVEVFGSGVFPPKGSARVVWAGLKGAEPLAGISARLEKALEPLGFAPEGRGFKPHLTLARVKNPSVSTAARSIATAYETTKFGVKGVAEVLLKRSVLRPQGPEYSTVVSVPLVG
jgi:RNA 2',3'-cyclic 3'-phosphodiesterase